jgi:putative endonuclease
VRTRREQLQRLRPPRTESGSQGEEAVAEFLGRQGYQIVARNLRIGHLELDIVARKGPVIAIVEVRTRGPGSWTTGFGSLNATKRLRIRRAGERLWQRRYKHDESVERLRFDAASVTFGPDGPVVEYVEAAL